jgi:hypothetical protein
MTVLTLLVAALGIGCCGLASLCLTQRTRIQELQQRCEARNRDKHLFDRVTAWAARTFGERATPANPSGRKPHGPLKHALKEILVEQMHYPLEKYTALVAELDEDQFTFELDEIADWSRILAADVLRCLGVSYDDFLCVCHQKQSINDVRMWNPPSPSGVVEHVR